MYHKINVNDENSQYIIDELLKSYKKDLDKDLIKLIKKLRLRSPSVKDTIIISSEEKEILLNNCTKYEDINLSLADLLDAIEDEEESSTPEGDEED